MTPGRLLTMTFLLGIGSAVSNPVWQATTPDLEKRGRPGFDVIGIPGLVIVIGDYGVTNP